jgi:DNA-binding response OmpR family regulator
LLVISSAERADGLTCSSGGLFRSAGEERLETQKRSGDAAQRPSKPSTVVVVDDDRETRQLLREVLERSGFRVLEAGSGLRLIGMLSVDRPDLILLDVMMSWVSGFELCRSLKQNPRFRHIPVCFISGRTDAASRREGIEAGAVDYFPKPLDVPRLIERARELTSRSPSPSPGA